MSVPFARSGPRSTLIASACLISLVLVPAVAMTSQSAHAVSSNVKNACKNDYFSFCAAHPVGSKALRKCMRAAGKKLSNRCVKALVAAGEVSKSDMARYAKRSR